MWFPTRQQVFLNYAITTRFIFNFKLDCYHQNPFVSNWSWLRLGLDNYPIYFYAITTRFIFNFKSNCYHQNPFVNNWSWLRLGLDNYPIYFYAITTKFIFNFKSNCYYQNIFVSDWSWLRLGLNNYPTYLGLKDPFVSTFMCFPTSWLCKGKQLRGTSTNFNSGNYL